MRSRTLAQQLNYSIVVRAVQPAALLILRDYSAVIRRKEACSASGSHADRNRVNARIT